MRLTRRHFVAGASAGIGLAALPGYAASRLEIGSIAIDTVSDGHLTLPGSFLLDGLPQDRVAPVTREELVEARTHGHHGVEDGGRHELGADPSSHNPKIDG